MEHNVVRVASSGEEIAPTSKAPAEEGPLPVTDKGPPFTPRVTLLPRTQPASPGSEAEAIEENGESATVEPDEEATRITESPSETAPSGSEAVPGGIRGAQVEPGTEEPSQGIGEAEETRRPAEELSDSDRQQIVDRVRRGLARAINKFRPLFDALGVPVLPRARQIALRQQLTRKG